MPSLPPAHRRRGGSPPSAGSHYRGPMQGAPPLPFPGSVSHEKIFPETSLFSPFPSPYLMTAGAGLGRGWEERGPAQTTSLPQRKGWLAWEACPPLPDGERGDLYRGDLPTGKSTPACHTPLPSFLPFGDGGYSFTPLGGEQFPFPSSSPSWEGEEVSRWELTHRFRGLWVVPPPPPSPCFPSQVRRMGGGRLPIPAWRSLPGGPTCTHACLLLARWSGRLLFMEISHTPHGLYMPSLPFPPLEVGGRDPFPTRRTPQQFLPSLNPFLRGWRGWGTFGAAGVGLSPGPHPHLPHSPPKLPTHAFPPNTCHLYTSQHFGIGDRETGLYSPALPHTCCSQWGRTHPSSHGTPGPLEEPDLLCSLPYLDSQPIPCLPVPSAPPGRRLYTHRAQAEEEGLCFPTLKAVSLPGCAIPLQERGRGLPPFPTRHPYPGWELFIVSPGCLMFLVFLDFPTFHVPFVTGGVPPHHHTPGAFPRTSSCDPSYLLLPHIDHLCQEERVRLEGDSTWEGQATPSWERMVPPSLPIPPCFSQPFPTPVMEAVCWGGGAGR